MAGFNPATWPTFNQNPLTQSLAAAQAFNRNNLTNDGLRFNNQHANEILALRKLIAANSDRNSRTAQENINLQYEKLKPQQINAAVRLTQDPSFQSWRAKNPELAAQVMQAYAGYVNTVNQTQNNPMPSIGGGVGQYYPTGGVPTPNLQGSQAYPGGSPMQPQIQSPMQPQYPPTHPAQMPIPPLQASQAKPMGAPQNSIVQVSPQEVAAAQDATESSLQKKITPEAVLRQRYYNKSIPPILDKIRKELPAASKYFGYRGAADSAGDKVLLGLGINPNSDYLKYQNLLQDYNNLVNESKRALGGPATDNEQKIIDLFAKPDLMHSTQESVLNNINNLENLFGVVDRTANLSPAQVSGTESPASSGIAPLLSRSSAGTVRMQGPDGRFYQVKSDQVDDAIKSHGWRRASG